MTREEAKIFLLQLNTDKQLNKSEHEALRIAIEALEQEPCEDCISRQAVMALAKEECETAIIPYKRFVKGVNSLPPVTPQPKTGHWIDRDVYDADRWKCSECGRTEPYKENYCPKCGAKMN
jgi:uncharacterized membrane protein YvbJ